VPSLAAPDDIQKKEKAQARHLSSGRVDQVRYRSPSERKAGRKERGREVKMSKTRCSRPGCREFVPMIALTERAPGPFCSRYCAAPGTTTTAEAVEVDEVSDGDPANTGRSAIWSGRWTPSPRCVAKQTTRPARGTIPSPDQ
jgi:hypothetical protein